ncbi:hypothetical protein SHL15_9002 [Streptomyces hygroscopicus subsp. limoneus]|nr:hypothetical protein SHL15_9002 [Streptomyces hygroscopicus subsp. limoneus]
MSTHSDSQKNRRAVMWRDAGAAGALCALGYSSVAYFIDKPLNEHWLIWPALAFACAMFAAGWKGFGESPRFIWPMSGLVIATAVFGAAMS